MEKDLADALRKSLLFRNMSNSEISSLLRSVDYQMRTFSKKEVILRDGELQSQLGVILSGQAYAFPHRRQRKQQPYGSDRTGRQYRSAQRCREISSARNSHSPQGDKSPVSVCGQTSGRKCQHRPGAGPFSAEPDLCPDSEGPETHKETGGFCPAHDQRKTAGLSFGSVSHGAQPQLCDPAEPAGAGGLSVRKPQLHVQRTLPHAG